MEYTTFGNSGLTVSRLCLGTAPFGKQTDEHTAHAILDTAAAAGVTFLDTADGYPMGADLTLVGRTEEIVGRWLHGKRDQFIVATKAGMPMGPAPWDQGGSRKHLLDAIDGSLKRLGTDYVDLYQLHFDDANTPVDETLDALDTIVRAGKARYVGVSNFLAYRLARAIGRAETLGLTRVASVQPRYNLLFRQIEREPCRWPSKKASRSFRSTRSPVDCSPGSTALPINRRRADSPPKSGRTSPRCTANGIGMKEDSTRSHA